MSIGLKVFLIYPAQIIVYNLEDPQTGNSFVFNAGNLEHLKNPHIVDYKEVDGYALSNFGVKPVVLGYKNGTFEIVYIPPGMNQVLLSDGSRAQPAKSPVISFSSIEIPILSSFPRLRPVALANPDESVLEQYIRNSQASSTTIGPVSASVASQNNVLSSPNSHLDATQSILPVISTSQNKMSVKAVDMGTQDPSTESPVPGFKSPSPRISKPKTNQNDVNNQVELMRQEINDLRLQLTALCRRIYQLYPVEIPEKLKFNGSEYPVISVEELKKKIAAGEIIQTIMDPLYQAFAGSHRSNVRLLTCIDKNGKVYHARAAYDPKENRIGSPKPA